jgi:3'(2'), 5'-bisphosphate nucleotidase
VFDTLIDTFLYAGDVAIELRNKGLTKEIKNDGTPVSNGDLEVNKIVTKKIFELTPNLPIVSEETSHNKSTKDLTNFWLVDPIDGTYDYINNLDEFTINAGLILNKKPVAGLIYAPVKKRMFYSYGKDLAYELTNGKLINLKCNNKANEGPIKFVAYSNKIKPEIEKIHKEIGVANFVRMKSSLKFATPISL